MNDTKAWWQSKTILASLVTVASGILATLTHQKVILSDTDQATIVESVSEAVTMLSGLIAIYGRAVAKTTVGAAVQK